MAHVVAVWVAVQRSSASSTGERSSTMVQAEPIRTTRPRLLMRLGSCTIPAPADYCQYCCQAAGQRLTDMYNSGISAQHTASDGRSWTMCLLLRIRRLGVRVPPSAPPNPQVDELVTPRRPRPRRHLALFWPYQCPRRRLRQHCRAGRRSGPSRRGTGARAVTWAAGSRSCCRSARAACRRRGGGDSGRWSQTPESQIPRWTTVADWVSVAYKRGDHKKHQQGPWLELRGAGDA